MERKFLSLILDFHEIRRIVNLRPTYEFLLRPDGGIIRGFNPLFMNNLLQKHKTKVSQFSNGLYCRDGNSALCSDGKIRSVRMAQCADTWFSIPASIRINGKTITGYVSCETQRCSSDNQDIYTFRHHNEQKWKHNLPSWHDFTDEEFDAVLELAL